VYGGFIMDNNTDTIPTEELMSNVKKYEAKTHYSGFGWFLFTFIGMSAKPVRVEFMERETGKVILSTTDPEVLKKYVGR
jgi:hypothetical protein